MEGIKALIFDFDGTLIDSAPDLAHAANRLMVEYDLPEFDVKTIAGFIGNGIPKLVERVMKARDIDLSQLADFTEQFKAKYQEDPTSRTIIFDHVVESLTTLQNKGIKLGLCTNKALSATKIILKNLDLARYFDAVIAGDSTKEMKPDPAPLTEAMRQLGVKASEVIYVGDSHIDMQAAQNTRLPFWFYSGGYCHVDPGQIQSDFTFSNFLEFNKKVLSD